MSRRIPDPAEEPTITVPRAAAVLGLGIRTAYDAIERGEMPAIRVGRAIRIPTARWLTAYGLLPSDPPTDGGTVAAGHESPSHRDVTTRRQARDPARGGKQRGEDLPTPA